VSGDPAPRVVPAPDGTPAFLNNGDRSYESGAFTKSGFSAADGLALEALLSTPVTTYRWQRASLELIASPRVVATGGFTGTAVCSLRVPAGEGGEDAGHWSTAAYHEVKRWPLHPALRSGHWVRVLIQRFPDGSCGFALDGRPVWRSIPATDSGELFRVGISGQSVNTRMLVGPFTLWKGIRSGIDWTVLEPSSAR